MTRISWISTSPHTHPLSPLIRADASGIANMISFASRGSSPAEWEFETTRVTRGSARNPLDPESGRAHPLNALFENCGRCGYVLSMEAVASAIVGSTSHATGAQNATRSRSSRGCDEKTDRLRSSTSFRNTTRICVLICAPYGGAL
jgi:hypothetical protein